MRWLALALLLAGCSKGCCLKRRWVVTDEACWRQCVLAAAQVMGGGDAKTCAKRLGCAHYEEACE